MRLLVGSLVGLLVSKSYHTKQKDGYSLPTNDPTNNRMMSKKIGLYNRTLIKNLEKERRDIHTSYFSVIFDVSECPEKMVFNIRIALHLISYFL